jgi:hypothetical protein
MPMTFVYTMICTARSPSSARKIKSEVKISGTTNCDYYDVPIDKEASADPQNRKGSLR